MKRSLQQHTATRQCPHRWCRPLHAVITTLGAVMFLVLAFHQLSTLLFFIATALVAIAVVGIITRRSLADTAADDLRPVIPLHVRPLWANLSVALDLPVVVMGPLAVLALLVAPANSLELQIMPDALQTAIVAIAFTVCREIAHWLATRPARPGRVLAPSAP
ncbi:hypothetical protein GCM10010193_69500 [Kitasatospora atroaurantiaca]|uniref:Uncharacterized protein n=1 Tax=Kitasatospora atroaurantiaca TaxID=285545 RepID=A0A561EN56_9ACTN|nr:hypothetical protein [Kitasatospora atroaurantiaca]TWE17037.1 hypothetical protein FB465_2041 [Kitasatospora atroaurantiaca]